MCSEQLSFICLFPAFDESFLNISSLTDFLLSKPSNLPSKSDIFLPAALQPFLQPWLQATASQQRTVKASLDDIKDTSVTALNNKQGKGKYWFKSSCPTPDPRWPEALQLMIGPVPVDLDNAQLRTALVAMGRTIHIFIQNKAAWLEKNQVKFGYVVYTDAAVPFGLLESGGIIVGKTKIRVKAMDGRPGYIL